MKNATAKSLIQVKAAIDFEQFNLTVRDPLEKLATIYEGSLANESQALDLTDDINSKRDAINSIRGPLESCTYTVPHE